MGYTGKHKVMHRRLLELKARTPLPADKQTIQWALSMATGQAWLSTTGNNILDAAPVGVLRWRVRYAEQHLSDALVALAASHEEVGCTCPGQCMLTHDWVPDQIRLRQETLT